MKTISTGPKAWHSLLESEQSWGLVYEGTREQLLAAGIVREDQLPGEPGVARKCRMRTTATDGRELTIERRGKRFCVWWHYTDNECRKRELDAALELEREEISKIPSSDGQFRECITKWALPHLLGIRAIMERGLFGGYRYAPEVLGAFDEAVAEIRGILADGKTLYDARRQQETIAAIKAQTAKADPGLQGFLDRLRNDSGETAT